MKNILLITNIYPNNDPNYTGTAVCHSFAKEWQGMGYNVQIIHFDSLFPRCYYWIGKLFNRTIKAKTGCVAYSNTPRKIIRYKVDSVSVIFAPLKKLIPHKSPSKIITQKVFDTVCKELEKDGFTPDVVTGHFLLPQLEMLYRFKQKYPNIKTCMVLHGNGEQIPTTYPNDYERYMQSVDIWGFRSLAFLRQFENLYGKQKKEFLCYSGVPEKYLISTDHNFINGIKRFVFVGGLLKLKNVDITLRALKIAMENKPYHFDIVGSGAERESLQKLIKELEMENFVTFHGQLSRDDAQKIIAMADCFVMVSSREAFGLVYVEAMAKGCITIATKGQGIDGIIIDGENGFLCPAKNVEALVDIINHIMGLSSFALRSISEKAITTANNLSDRKVAQNYINTIITD